jgi:cytochrome c oxidase assembly protein subunit 15
VPEADFAHGFDFTQEVGPNYLGGALYGEGRVAIHFVHRLGALIVAALGLWMILRLLRAPETLGLRRWGQALGAVLGLQISLGIGNVVLGLPLVVATAHNAVGAALLLVTVAVNYRLHTATRASAS